MGWKKFKRKKNEELKVEKKWNVDEGWDGGGLYFRRIGDKEYFEKWR